MIFRPELAAKVMDGSKTVTRRAPSPNPRSPWWEGRCALVPGREYAVQPGRGVPSVGRVRVLKVERVRLGMVGDIEARREGFVDRNAFERVWSQLHGGYDRHQLVWRVEFERV